MRNLAGEKTKAEGSEEGPINQRIGAWGPLIGAQSGWG